MKTIIAGSRNITDFNILLRAIENAEIENNIVPTEVVCGEARGVDSMGKIWAEMNQICIKSFPANWNKYGKSAGMIRNKQMAEYADALIAIRKSYSKGTTNMIDTMKSLNKIIYVLELN